MYEGLGDLGWSLKKAVKKVVHSPGKIVKSAVKNTITRPIKIASSITRAPIRLASKKVKFLEPLSNLHKRTTKKLVNRIGTTVDKGSKITGAVVKKGLPFAFAPLALLSRHTSKAPAEATPVPDGPLVKIYLTDGSEAEIPSNYLTNGTYTDENGNLWTTSPPRMVKIFSPYGDEATLPEGLVKGGRYTDESGTIWSTTKPRDIKIYSPYGDEATLPEGYISNGQYVSEDGTLWSINPTPPEILGPVPMKGPVDTQSVVSTQLTQVVQASAPSILASAPTPSILSPVSPSAYQTYDNSGYGYDNSGYAYDEKPMFDEEKFVETDNIEQVTDSEHVTDGEQVVIKKNWAIRFLELIQPIEKTSR